MENFFVPVFYTILQIITLLALGFASRRFLKLPKELFSGIAGFIAKVGLPILFFARLSTTNMQSVIEGWLLPFLCIVINGISLGVPFIISRFTGYSQHHKRLITALAGFGNSGFMPLTLADLLAAGIPLVAMHFNPDQATLYIGLFLLVQSPLLWSIGNFLVSGKTGPFQPKYLITPSLIGIVTGLVFAVLGAGPLFQNVELPFYYIHQGMKSVGETVLPLVIFNLGSMIADIEIPKDKIHHFIKMSAAVNIFRLLVLPALFYTYFFLLQPLLKLPMPVVWIIFLETHVPTATNLSIMAATAKCNEHETSFTLLTGYIFYPIILPFSLSYFLSLI